MLNNLVCIDSDIFFKSSTVCSITRGYSLKLTKCHTISKREAIFGNRIINV